MFGCSIGARGLWHEMMGLMHESPRYGYLCDQKGEPIPSQQVARMCGVEFKEYELLLAELLAAGVPRVSSGKILYSKRMVEDHKKREEWRKRQNNHRLTARDVTQGVTPVSRPSSSSSSSSTSNLKPKPKTLVQQKPLDAWPFSRFWDLFPRREGKAKALLKWNRMTTADREAAALGISHWQRSGRWDDPQFIPMPTTYLNGRRWEDEIVPAGMDDRRSRRDEELRRETQVGAGPEIIRQPRPPEELLPMPKEFHDALSSIAGKKGIQ